MSRKRSQRKRNKQKKFNNNQWNQNNTPANVDMKVNENNFKKFHGPNSKVLKKKLHNLNREKALKLSSALNHSFNVNKGVETIVELDSKSEQVVNSFAQSNRNDVNIGPAGSKNRGVVQNLGLNRKKLKKSNFQTYKVKDEVKEIDNGLDYNQGDGFQFEPTGAPNKPNGSKDKGVVSDLNINPRKKAKKVQVRPSILTESNFAYPPSALKIEPNGFKNHGTVNELTENHCKKSKNINSLTNEIKVAPKLTENNISYNLGVGVQIDPTETGLSNNFKNNKRKSKKKLYANTTESTNVSINGAGPISSGYQMKGQQNQSMQLVPNYIVEQRRSLPIYSYRKELLKAIRQCSTLILIGETACGKTTQIPQYLFEDGLLKSGNMGIVQPRRVAAITIAQRVAIEVGCELGTSVGYSVRFEDVTSSSTKLKYLTDGMLLRESILDPLLSSYRVIILDEAHERTINTDVLFGIVKNVQATRKKRNLLPLKVIVMSATMDVDNFSKYFNNCPVFYLQGRQYPIQIMYASKPQQDYVFSALVTAFQIHQNEPEGDILVFCTGQEEIESMVKSVRDTSLLLPHGSLSVIPCPLYAALPNAKQLKVFGKTPKGHRKMIFSTNIAETSVTISGVRYVIDTGMVKARTYHAGSGFDLLKVQRVSKAQAVQRAGRAGRETSGCCYRLYTVKEYEKLPDHSLPEIQRCNLSSVLLQLLAIGVQNVADFDFMDKPSNDNIKSALGQLHLLNAIDSPINSKLTALGKSMSTFPLEPKFAKVILASKDFNCTDEILSIIAMLSVESVIHIPNNKRDLAAKVMRKFESNEGDHIMLLNIYKAYKSAKGNKEWCKENFVNERNLSVAIDIRQQLRDICAKADIQHKSCGTELSNIRHCLLTGFFMNVAELQQSGHYLTIDSRQKVVIHPSSCLFKCKPSYILFNELLQTSKCYMRNVSLIDPEWLIATAPQYFNEKRLQLKT